MNSNLLFYFFVSIFSLKVQAETGLMLHSPAQSFFKIANKITSSVASLSATKNHFSLSDILMALTQKKSLSEKLQSELETALISGNHEKKLEQGNNLQIRSKWQKEYESKQELHEQLQSKRHEKLSEQEFEQLAYLDSLEKIVEESPGYEGKQSQTIQNTLNQEKALKGKKQPGMWIAPQQQNKKSDENNLPEQTGNVGLVVLQTSAPVHYQSIMLENQLHYFPVPTFNSGLSPYAASYIPAQSSASGNFRFSASATPFTPSQSSETAASGATSESVVTLVIGQISKGFKKKENRGKLQEFFRKVGIRPVKSEVNGGKEFRFADGIIFVDVSQEDAGVVLNNFPVIWSKRKSVDLEYGTSETIKKEYPGNGYFQYPVTISSATDALQITFEGVVTIVIKHISQEFQKPKNKNELKKFFEMVGIHPVKSGSIRDKAVRFGPPGIIFVDVSQKDADALLSGFPVIWCKFNSLVLEHDTSGAKPSPEKGYLQYPITIELNRNSVRAQSTPAQSSASSAPTASAATAASGSNPGSISDNEEDPNAGPIIDDDEDSDASTIIEEE